MMTFIQDRPATATALILLVAFAIVAFVILDSGTLVTLEADPITYDSIVELLTAVFLIALFLERAIEVFVSTSRKLGRADIDARLEKGREKIVQLNDRLKLFEVQLESPGGTAEQAALHARIEKVNDAIPPAQRVVRTAEGDLEKYRAKTRLVTFAAGVALGLVIAIAGLRVVSPLVDLEPLAELKYQLLVFHCVDVALTAGLLAGGASGIHQIVSVFGEYTDKVRKGVQT